MKTWTRWQLWTLAVLLLGLTISSCGGDSDNEADGDTDGDGSVILDGDNADGDDPDGDDPDGDDPDGDDPDGDDPDGDDPDGDDPDGDTDGDTDGDDTDGDRPTSGSIAGTVHFSDALAPFDSIVNLYADNPFESADATPLATQTLAGGSAGRQDPYLFDELDNGYYYLSVSIDVDNDDDPSNDQIAVHPEKVLLVVNDDLVRDRTDIDIYAGVQAEGAGRISGTLHVSAALRDKAIFVAVAQHLPSGEVEAWPSAVDITPAAPASESRPFSLNSLPDGKTYTLVAFTEATADEMASSFVSPYNPYEIDVAIPAKKFYDSEVFYLGLADPAFGSVSGSLTLSGSVTGGLLGVYLFDYDDILEPRSYLFVDKDDTTRTYNYVVGNLLEQSDFWVAGFLQIDETHLSVGYHEDPLNIDFNATKDWTGINMNLPITELTGTVNVTNAPENFTAARLVLAKFEGLNLVMGGGVDIELGASSGGQRSADYALFPVKGGSWIPVVVLDEDNDGLDDEDRWCYSLLRNINVDGSQRSVNQTITTSMGECQNP